MNALVIKASPIYILKQMPHVSICFRFSSLCLWKKKPKFWTIESIVSSHNSVDHLEINHDISNCNETAIIIPISNEASTLNVLFGLQQTFCRRAGKSLQFALVAQRCNLALQPNLELIQRQTWFFVQSCRARVFTSLH